MKIVFLPAAIHDLEWFCRYYQQVFPDGAQKATDQYQKAIHLLGQRPKLGHPIAEEGIREYAIPRTPFSFIYRIQSGRIEVLRFWDQRGDRSEHWIDD